MSNEIEELLPYLGLELFEPWDDESRQEFYAALGGDVPPDVDAFYALTDGGEVPSVECRFYGLEEAVEVAEHVREIHTSMPVLPVFESSGEASDPCCVLLDDDFKGVFVQFHHDGNSRVHASSFLDFLNAFAETEEGPLAASRHKFCYPKKLTKKEKTIALKFVERSKEPVPKDSPCLNADNEPALMVELAQSMTTPKAMPELFDPLDLQDGRARAKAAMELYYSDTPAAREKLESYCEAMNRFANELQSQLGKEGIEVDLKSSQGIVPTTWIVYRGRRVLVDEVYSKLPAPSCWDGTRKWMAEMDRILQQFED